MDPTKMFQTLLFILQRSKFASAVSKCEGFCPGISPFYSICLGNKMPRQLNSSNLKKNVFLELKNKFFVKEKKTSFIKKSFLQDTTYSCASIYIIHTFISYIHTFINQCVKEILFSWNFIMSCIERGYWRNTLFSF